MKFIKKRLPNAIGKILRISSPGIKRRLMPDDSGKIIFPYSPVGVDGTGEISIDGWEEPEKFWKDYLKKTHG